LEIFVSETFTQRQQHISGIRKRMSHQVFATETWPLFELKALDLGDECRLFISIDALIMDAWSYQVLLSDVNTYYQEPTLELPTLDVSFRDYVSWLVRYHQTHAYERAKMYWLERLNTLPAAPALPMKKRPNEISKPTFVRREFFLSREAWSALQKRGQKRKVTPTVILLMAYSQVLAQWSRDPHFTLNLTLFNRPPVHPDIDRLIGDFTSTTLLEITDSADTFENRATMLQKQLWMDLENRAFSGLDVLRAMVRSKADGQPILMPVVFTGAIGFEAQQGALGDTESLLSQLGGQVDYQISQTPQVWLDHTVNEAGGKLHVCWDAVEDVFPAGMLDAMFDIYTTLLNMLAGSDEAWLSPHVNRLPPTQRAVRDAFNHTYVPRQPTTLSQLFLDSVSRHRNAIALIGPTMTLSYGELFNRAAEIAAQLQQLEIKKNELVAVAMEKCEEQVIACLGIHLAGAAYVPIDAALPTDRQKSLFEQSGVRFAVTQMRWPTTLLRPEGVTFISGKDSMECIDSPLDMLGLQGVSSRDLAYVIFTSGSTGTPKGVSIDHRGACNTIMDLNRRFSITAADRVYALSSLSFDLSVFDIFGTLAAGGTVVVPDKRSSHNPGEWCHQIVDQGITIWNSVPALMGLLLDYAHEKSFDLSGHLRLVLLSGDWIPVTLVPLMQRYLPQAQLISLGGATEASIWSVYHSIRDLNQDWNSVPYGQPLENQQCFILNAHGDECPDWVTGELFIGGQGVAMGYWKDEVKTCASFIAYPQTGERIYRTGDLVRFRPDGGMEFIGRNDSQVKLNGNRIELGEIETVLAPALVKKCVACLEDGENDKELIAYVVLNSGIERQTHEGKLLMSRLRQHLLETLPVYMVPKTLFVVDNLPLTTNGKIDRKGLRLLRLSEERNRQSDNVRTQVINHEEITDGICRLVAETLNVEHVDPEENLLEKGMTSIDFIRIFNQLEGRYGVRPDFAMLYREPRVSSISRSISENQVPGNKAEVKKKILLSPEKRDEFKRSRNFLRKEFTTHKTHTLQYSSVFSETDHLAWMAQRKTAAQFVHKQLRGEVLTALMNRLAFIEHGEKLRTLYPSAGALYPVQTYLQVEKGMVAGLEAGLYYFQPVEKLLILISPERPIDQHHHYPVNQSAAASSAFTLFLIADLRAIEPIYGEVGRDMCLIEAGAMLQLLMWDCKSLGIDLRPIGGVVFESARQPLQLSSDHILLHTILGGASLVEPEQTTKKEYIELSI
jgi:amino acid adenylation domain-containing protein